MLPWSLLGYLVTMYTDARLRLPGKLGLQSYNCHAQRCRNYVCMYMYGGMPSAFLHVAGQLLYLVKVLVL